MVRGAALTLLERGGSAAALRPLLDAFLRLESAGIAPADANKQGSEFGFVSALTRGAGWMLTPDQFRIVFAACSTEECRRRVSMAQKLLEAPINVSPTAGGPLDFGEFMMGSVQLHGRKQLEERTAQFPKGTQFFIGRYEGTAWYVERRAREIREVLEAAGMRIVDAPRILP